MCCKIAHQHDGHRTGEIQRPPPPRQGSSSGSRRSASIYAWPPPPGPLASSALAWDSTTGSLSTYTTRHSGADALGHLVRVVRGRQAGADVQELADPGLAHQVPDRPPQEGPVPRAERTMSDEPRSLFSGYPVAGEVILPAQPVVIDPGDVRNGGVHPGRHRPGIVRPTG